jgi:hypothetical protein
MGGAQTRRAVSVFDDRRAGLVLATAGGSWRIPIFAMSTSDTDYVLIKRQNLEQAVVVLGAARHEKVG